jgi:FKBP-type peptidyl-prolyl cis-trans isomerase 2
MNTHRIVVILAALAFGIVGPVRAADVTGKWKAEFDTQIGHLKYTYDLKADGDKITGKAVREQDGQKTETEIKEGKVSADQVSFVEPLKIQDQDIRIDYTGKLAGDEIKFTRKVGDFATTEIVARREKEAVASVAGKWQAEFDTQIGKQSYTYEFKVDGDKVTGKAIGGIAGQTSDTEIAQGKVNGADISFVENLKFGDMDIRVDYTGKLAGDEIKFTRKVGEVATEELVAKRVK